MLIPEGQKQRAGELVVFANRRGIAGSRSSTSSRRRSSGRSEGTRTRGSRASWLQETTLNIKYLKPGNLYLFWGYNGPIIQISRSQATRSGRRCCSIMAIRIQQPDPENQHGAARFATSVASSRKPRKAPSASRSKSTKVVASSTDLRSRYDGIGREIVIRPAQGDALHDHPDRLRSRLARAPGDA